MVLKDGARDIASGAQPGTLTGTMAAAGVGGLVENLQGDLRPEG